MLDRLYEALTSTPEGFDVHPKLARQFESRDKMWGEATSTGRSAEAFAIGSVLDGGTSVRLAGQDTSRARSPTVTPPCTTTRPVASTPRSRRWPDRGRSSGSTTRRCRSTPALGFEYGYTVANPDALVIWEAQFGDFINGAQIIIDQFLVAAEDKWNEPTGLVMLLPHGYEGQGPEHSSGRLERFLLLCAEDNIQVANVTTSAQFFHLLRRQIGAQRPQAPRRVHPEVGAAGQDDAVAHRGLHLRFVPGGARRQGPAGDPKTVQRVILASGKVASEALTHRDEKGITAAAVVRVEQLYPWPFDAVADAIAGYPERQGDRVAAGRAREHGSVECGQGSPL